MSTSNAPSSRRTRRSGDTFVSVMSDVASSVRELMQTSTQKVYVDDVYDKVSMVHDFDEYQKLETYVFRN